jgi:hypothetical protein
MNYPSDITRDQFGKIVRIPVNAATYSVFNAATRSEQSDASRFWLKVAGLVNDF